MNQERVIKYTNLINDPNPEVREAAEETILFLSKNNRDDCFNSLLNICKENISDETKCANSINTLLAFVKNNETSEKQKEEVVSFIFEVVSAYPSIQAATSKTASEIVSLVAENSMDVAANFIEKFESDKTFRPASLAIYYHLIAKYRSDLISHVRGSMKNTAGFLTLPEALQYRQIFAKLFLLALSIFQEAPKTAENEEKREEKSEKVNETESENYPINTDNSYPVNTENDYPVNTENDYPVNTDNDYPVNTNNDFPDCTSNAFSNIQIGGLKGTNASGVEAETSTACCAMFNSTASVFFEQSVPHTEMKEAFEILVKCSNFILPDQYAECIKLGLGKINVLILEEDLYDSAVKTIAQLVTQTTNSLPLRQFVQSTVQPLVRKMTVKNEDVFRILEKFNEADHERTISLTLDIIINSSPDFPLGFILEFVQKKLINSDDSKKIISTLSTILSRETDCSTRQLITQLWAELVEFDADTDSIFPMIVKLAASPRYPKATATFEECLKRVAPKLHYFDMPTLCFDNSNILIAASLFNACKQIKGSLKCTAMSPISIRTKGFVYANCELFDVQTRSDILNCVGRVIQEADWLTASDELYNKLSVFHAQKIIHNLIMKAYTLNNQTESWILSAQTVTDQIAQEKHPDMILRTIVNEKTDLQFKASIFCFATAVMSVEENHSIAQARLSSLFNKFKFKNKPQVHQLAQCIVTVSKWNKVLAAELFRQRIDGMKKANQKEFSRRILTLEYQIKCGTIDQQVVDLCLDYDVPLEIAAHAQKIILHKYKVSDTKNQLKLLDKLLLSKNMYVLKTAIESLLFMIKENMFDTESADISTHLKKAFAALKYENSERMIKDMVLELISLTRPEVNFANLCIFAFNEDKEFSKFAVKTAVDVVNKATDTSKLRTAMSCAPVALLLNSKEDFDDALIFSQKIFQSNRPPDEFALQYFLSSPEKDKDEFISFMFSFLNLPEPWCYYAEHVISRLIKDIRFASVLDSAYTNFGAAVSSSQTYIFKELGTALFQLNRTKFINTLLVRKITQMNQVISLFASIFPIVAKDLLEVATTTKVEENCTLHQATVRIITEAKEIPEEEVVNLLVLICLILAQNYKLLSDCTAAINRLAEYLPEIKSQRIQSCLKEATYTQGPVTFVTIRSLFTLISSQLTTIHLKGFINFAPVGALAGYSEIISHGRPMLPEIMALTEVAPNAVLLTLPSIKMLTPDRYGDYMLNKIIDFIVSQMQNDEDAFRAILELFDWLPEHLIMGKCKEIFSATIAALRVENPPQSAFNCVSMFADSPLFVGKKEFRESLWMMAVIALGFSEGVDLQIVAVARTALCSLAQHAAMYGTVAILEENIGKIEGFSIGALTTFVREMDNECIDAAFYVLEDPSVEQKIRAAELICAAMHEGKCLPRRPHLRLLPLMASDNDKIKIGVLNALKTFPPKL